MAEGITLKRIIDMDEAAELSSSDYALVDSATGGPKKFALGNELSSLKEDCLDIDDRVTALEGGGSGSGLTEDIKAALLQMARKVAYIDADGQDYYDDLYDALYTVTAISVNPTTVTLQTIGGTQQLTATTTPSGASVSWASSNTAVATVDANGLVTSVGYGSATITATAGQLSATCAVVVAQATVTSIDAVYTQSGTVYDTDSLDSLKDDLVVTAHWSNGTASTVASADYTLSGTLTVGTSTITVTYGGKTTTFTVTVSAGLYPMTITASDSGVGFGSVDVTKNTTTPPYRANTNGNRVYAYGANALGYEINPAKQYRISVTATEDVNVKMIIHEFNETAYAALQNIEAVPTGNKTASSWLSITPSTPYTYTPTQLINNEPPVCIWLTFKQADDNWWTSLDGSVFPITIEQL